MALGDVRDGALRGRRRAKPAAPARARRAAPTVSPFKKVLLTFMVLGAMGTTVGAGTFASFTASTTHGATFATGTVVLSDQKDTNSACISTSGASTDTNANGACEPLIDEYNASVMRPGEVGQVNLTLKNLGSLAGTLAGYMTSADACADGAVAGSNWSLGTGAPCQKLQFAIQEYTDGARGTTSVCRWGAGATGVIEGSALTFGPNKTITNGSNDVIRIQYNGTTTANIDLVTTTTNYSSIDALATAVQAKIQAVAPGVLVSGTPDNKLQISNPMPASGTNGIAILNPNPNTASGVTNLGFTANQASTGGAQTCTLGNALSSDDATHTIGNYQSLYPTSGAGLPMGNLSMANAPGDTRYYAIRILLPEGSDNQLQGRKATFGLTWTLLQS
jgi:hypothetical protein